MLDVSQFGDLQMMLTVCSLPPNPFVMGWQEVTGVVLKDCMVKNVWRLARKT